MSPKEGVFSQLVSQKFILIMCRCFFIDFNFEANWFKSPRDKTFLQFTNLLCCRSRTFIAVNLFFFLLVITTQY